MKDIFIFLISLLFWSFQPQPTLKGTWEYAGDIYNGKKEGAPTDYALRRKYDKENYTAFAVQEGYKDEKYEAGNYMLKGDTCIETETYCSQPSKLIGKTVHYLYSVRNDTLTLKGTLPSGMKVTEYWKKVK